LHKLLSSSKETVALGAAKAVLEIGPKLHDMEEMETRLAELEKLVAAQQPKKGGIE
jgi:hypothetical protein